MHLFLKNTIKKKNFKSYFFTLFILNLGLFLIKTISISLNEQIVLKQNEIQYRSIMVEPIRDETFFSTLKNNLNIMEINNKEDYLEIIVSDFRHVKEITDVLEGKYLYETVKFNQDNNLLFLMNFVCILIKTSIYIFLGIIIFQFNFDDKKVIQILSAIGYSNRKLFLIQMVCFGIIWSCPILASLHMELLINLFLKNYLIINKNRVIKEYLKLLLNAYVIPIILYCISYYLTNSKKKL